MLDFPWRQWVILNINTGDDREGSVEQAKACNIAKFFIIFM